MRYIVAVSGGVDSVVLLNMLVNGELSTDNLHAKGTNALHGLQGEERFLEFISKNEAEGQAPPDFIIAHFDHGIRSESADDADFVRNLAEKYGLPFETKREELGANASEEKARERRYAFLRDIAKKHDGKIMTAHHADDINETIAINLTRGTGWRGLAVLNSQDIERPLLGMTKTELMNYAKSNKLKWHEDATNQDTKYLRNDLRQRLVELDDDAKELLRRYCTRQVFLRKEVDNEANRLVGASPYERHLFISVPEHVAMELLRAVLVNETGNSPTRPGLRRALHAIKVLHAGKKYDTDAGIKMHFTKTHFIVSTDK